ncbi:MAG: hypothetical protein KJ583_01280 [Nanoarchaeota archaeon]|nr:hypothetical protein [Nanoarchaeota archaeon]MBU1603924.1 hypothetical protein [Nanoarchaeota archaeon]MBU2442509.1 hypothetical protein [Nanoarchaeota archaeon]
MKKEVRDCFVIATKDEKKGKKHKGLIIYKPDNKVAEDYITKAKVNLQLCDFYKEKGFDYKIPEEWFYTLYYCALAILSKFGIESRSQKCTAFFLRYANNNKLIEYEDEFIDRITVYSAKDEKSDVDERETARYSSSITSKEVESKYKHMTNICKKAISQAEEIVFSDKEFKVPKELYE